MKRTNNSHDVSPVIPAGALLASDWLRLYGPDYEINSREYLRQCCAGVEVDTPMGRVKRKLPDGWQAIKIGRDWWIHQEKRKEAKKHETRSKT